MKPTRAGIPDKEPNPRLDRAAQAVNCKQSLLRLSLKHYDRQVSYRTLSDIGYSQRSAVSGPAASGYFEK